MPSPAADPRPPAALGRGVVVLPGGEVPAGWAGCPTVRVGSEELASPSEAVATLHDAWLGRRPVVVELACDPDELRRPERHTGPVHALDARFELWRDRLQFLVWANNYDARRGAPVWWHGRRAARRLDGVTEEGPADVVDAHGRACFVDGGPPDPPPLPTGTAVVHRWSAEAGSLAPAGHDAPAADLAPDQRAAVAHGAGAARVLAPAGSGKTRVLTERLRHLLADRRVPPATVTAVAFNTRAADELKARCGELLGPSGPHVRTLNSLGLWICNRWGGRRHDVLDEAGARRLVEQVFAVRHQANTDTVAPYLDALSSVRLGLRHPEEVAAAIPDAAGLAEGFDAYRAALRQAGAVDFDEQIYRAVEILVGDPEARAAAQATCRRLLVDELQDLTPAHVLLVRLLAAPGYDCFGVGDDDQVLYGYSGATPALLIDFARYFPGAGTHALEVNYRCPPAVVGAARHLLSYNRVRVAKEVRSPAGRHDPAPLPEGPLAGAGPLALVRGPVLELPHVAVEVLRAWLAAGSGAEEVAVLARVNSALLPVQVACAEAGLATSAPLGPAALRRTGARTALAYLRMAADPGRIAAADVLDTVHRPPRRISRNVVDMLTRRGTTSVADVRRLARRLSGGDVEKLLGYAGDVEAVAAAAEDSSAAALRAVRDQVGLGASMDDLDATGREADRSTHADDLLALEAVAALHPDAGTFEAWLRRLLAQPPAEGPAVLLSTVHRIKGKEWPRVLVYGANRGLLPHRLSDDEEGERRVLHVALTRARTQVAVLADADEPSPFLAELDGTRPRPAARPPRRPGERDRGGDRGARGRDRASRDHRGRGQPDRAGAPGEPAAAAVTPAVAAAEAALRTWRSATAKRDRVPAYVVLNDRELRGIAERRPGTMAALARCRGMGPIRLERYGDELLAALESAPAPSS